MPANGRPYGGGTAPPFDSDIFVEGVDVDINEAGRMSHANQDRLIDDDALERLPLGGRGRGVSGRRGQQQGQQGQWCLLHAGPPTIFWMGFAGYRPSETAPKRLQQGLRRHGPGASDASGCATWG